MQPNSNPSTNLNNPDPFHPEEPTTPPSLSGGSSRVIQPLSSSQTPSPQPPAPSPSPVNISPLILNPSEPVQPLEQASPVPIEPQATQPSVAPQSFSDLQAPASPQPTVSPAPQPAVFSSSEASSGSSFGMPTPVVGVPLTPAGLPPAAKQPGRRRKKMLIISGALAAVIVLASLGYVFGFYIPSKPENVYRTSMDRSGRAIEALVEKASEKGIAEKFKKTELTGKLSVESDTFNVNGSFSSKFDSTKLDGSLDLAFKDKDTPEQKFGIKLLSAAASEGDYPDSYIQFSGLSALGAGQMMPGINSLDNKWIGISSAFLQSLDPQGEFKKSNTDTNFTYEDGSELAKSVIGPTRDYLFSADPEKAVITQKEFIGIEKVDDLTAYHYKVAFNKGNAKKYCESLINSAMSSNAYKKIVGEEQAKNVEESKKSIIKECQESAERDIKEGETFDMWVDKKYKLIYKFRFAEDNKSESYMEVGQRYKGGDDVSMFIKLHYKSGEAVFTLDTNTKSAVSKGALDMSFNESGSKIKAAASFESKPYTGEIKIETPADAVPLDQALQQMGLDPSILSNLSLFGPFGLVSPQVDAKDLEQ
jgi:hypothetical protein